MRLAARLAVRVVAPARRLEPSACVETIARAIDDVAATVARMREFYRPREGPQAQRALDVRQTAHLHSLGAGGMGVVYRARDLLHEQYGDPDPYVAVKMLSEELGDAPDAGALLAA